MGEETKNDLYMISKDGKETKIGKNISIPKFATGGIIRERIEKPILDGCYKPIVKPKNISKKRSIKLLMSWGFQRNEAYKVDAEYLKFINFRTRIGLLLFVGLYKVQQEKKEGKMQKPTKCRYCGNEVIFTSNAEVYGREYGSGRCYLCRRCRAFVGIHQGTDIPLGTLANDELRQYRKQAHYWFDQIWKKPLRLSTRYKAYGWLAHEMKLSREETHIALFEIEQCKQVIELVKERISKRKEV